MSQQEEPKTQRPHHYGSSGEYAEHGTLDQGYGQSEQMGEDHWSAENYEQTAEPIDRRALDEGEAHVEGQESDIDRLVGGEMGSTTAPSSEASDGDPDGRGD